jgi:hypothetical protein
MDVGCGRTGGPRDFLGLAEGRRVPRGDGTSYSSHCRDGRGGTDIDGRKSWGEGYRREEGGVNEREQTGGLVTYREEGRGSQGKGHEAQNPLTGNPYFFLLA